MTDIFLQQQNYTTNASEQPRNHAERTDTRRERREESPPPSGTTKTQLFEIKCERTPVKIATNGERKGRNHTKQGIGGTKQAETEHRHEDIAPMTLYNEYELKLIFSELCASEVNVGNMEQNWHRWKEDTELNTTIQELVEKDDIEKIIEYCQSQWGKTRNLAFVLLLRRKILEGVTSDAIIGLIDTYIYFQIQNSETLHGR